MSTINQDHITVALAQIAPVWLNRIATTAKIVDYVQQAAKQGARLDTLAFADAPSSPALLPLAGEGSFLQCLLQDTLLNLLYRTG